MHSDKSGFCVACPDTRQDSEVSGGRTYIRARVPAQGGAFGAIVERLRPSPAWRVRETDTGHDEMITRPAELTELFLEEVALAA